MRQKYLVKAHVSATTSIDQITNNALKFVAFV